MFRFSQRIRFSHCDPAGVLYFPHVFDFASTAVEAWFEERLGLRFDTMHMERRWGNPVVRTLCGFTTPCRFGEDLVLHLEPIAIGRSSMETRIVGSVAGAPRFRIRHKTAMMSMDAMRSMEIPQDIRARAAAGLGAPEPGPLAAVDVGEVPANAFRSRQLVRYAHCDPGERVYFARFFDMFNAALEDWFAEGLGAPWGSDFMVPPRDMRAPSLCIDAEFLHACVLGDPLDFELWVRRLGRSSFELALVGSVGGQVRLRAVWTLCTIAFGTGRAVPLPDDLRHAMTRFLAA